MLVWWTCFAVQEWKSELMRSYRGCQYETFHFCLGSTTWGCKMHGKTELGRIAVEKLFELDPQDSGNHVLLSNMLASAGR
jgi:hypothetical protein